MNLVATTSTFRPLGKNTVADTRPVENLRAHRQIQSWVSFMTIRGTLRTTVTSVTMTASEVQEK